MLTRRDPATGHYHPTEARQCRCGAWCPADRDPCHAWALSARDRAAAALDRATEDLARRRRSLRRARDVAGHYRNPESLHRLAVAEAAAREGWEFGTPDFSLDPQTAIGRYVLTSLAASARLQRDMGAERTAQALAAKAARGERAGGRVQLPDHVRERIGRERAAGRTLAAIAEGLTADRVPTARGGRWHPSTIRRVLDSLDYEAELAARRERRA